MTNKKICIVGAGILGILLLKKAKENGYEVVAFIDTFKTGEIDGIKIISPNDIEKYLYDFKGEFWITIVEKKAEQAFFNLLSKSFNPDSIVFLKNALFIFDDFYDLLSDENFFWCSHKEINDEEFNRSVKLFDELESIEILNKWKNIRTSWKIENYVDFIDNQYVCFDLINYIKNNKDITILDVGAYTGDTILTFYEYFNDKQLKPNFIAVEAIKENFEKLVQNTKILNCNSGIDIINLPIAAWNEPKFLSFTFNDTASTVTTETNSNKVLSYPLDDIISNHKIDIIKMDIEGAEKEAILGLKETIKKYNPILMISLYHKFDDFYKIPLLINEISNNYEMKIRVHSNLFIESVLYCFPKNGG